MKNISFVTIFLLCAILSSCDDKTPELIFTEVSNTSPEHILYIFSSPDPECVPRQATIYTDQFGGEITIKSTNAPSFYLGYMSDPDNNFYTCPAENVGSDPDYYYSEQGQWSARLVDNNTLVFDFKPVDADDLTENGAWFYLPVSASVKGKVVNTRIAICRTYDYSYYDKPDEPDKEIKTEGDIEYYELCPIDKYSIATSFTIGEDNRIFSRDAQSVGMPYDACRIWLEVAMDKADPNYILFNSVPYMAIYSYVISPLTDEIRLVRNNSHGPMFEEVIPMNEFDYICNKMPAGKELHYSLILANIEKKGLQKLNFTVKK